MAASLFAGFLYASAVCAQEPASNKNDVAPERPRIGLVLGGGAAKGAAHIGVLQVLEELRVPVDCIAGTSMGALVGATFAAGKSPQDIERSVVGINWSQTLGGQGMRNEIPINRKLTEMTYSNTLDFGVGQGGLRTPPGLIKTQQIEGVIRTLVSGERYTDDFDDLPIPFRAVATDMVSGNMVILASGDLSIAMRASMAVPGAFAPVQQDGMVLADGGMTRNLPVDVARDLCADVVIAVWLSTPPPEAGDLASALSLVGRSLDVMIDANQKAQIATLSGADVGISVPMGDIGSGDFDRAPEAIALGRAAAESNADALKRLAVDEDAYLAWTQRSRRAVSDAGSVAEVRIVGVKRVNPGYIQAHIEDVVPGNNVNVEQLAERVFALGDFEHVGYRLTGPIDQQVLEINAIEKSWGPNFLRFDLGFTTDGNNDLRALLRADHYLPWINQRGGLWHNTVQVGQQSLISTDFYQPLDLRQTFFVQPAAVYQNELEDIYLDGERVARYYFQQLYGAVDVGMNFGTRAQARFGIRSGINDDELDTGISGFPEVHHQRDSSMRFRVAYDTRDSVGLPTQGAFLNARYVHSQSWFGSDLDYELVEGVYSPAFKFRGKSLSLIFGGGSTLSGDPPATETFQLGGIRTFPGLRTGELRGTEYWLAGARFLWQLTEIQPLFDQALYAGLRIQAGEVSGFSADSGGTLLGISGSLGGRTPVGPFLLSLGYVDNDSLRLQFTVGRPVDEGSILDELQ